MTRRISIIFALLAFLTTPTSAQSLTYYEYWLDNDLSQRTTIASSDSELSLGIDISGLTDGLHLLSLRGQGDDGVWGAAKTRMFYILFKGSAQKAVEYWMDNDFDNRKEQTSVGDSLCIDINVESLHDGLHTLSFRGKNEDGVWGAVKTRMFYILFKGSAQKAVEYWMDNDFDNRTELTSVGDSLCIDINVESLHDGLHTLSFRGKNEDGVWGAAKTRMFYILFKGSAQKAVEYWMDNDFDNRTELTSVGDSLCIDINVESLHDGLHTLSFRGKNEEGVWGTAKTRMFYISRGDIYLRLCEYWFDEKYEQHRTQDVSGAIGELAMNIDISELKDGLHFFNIRAQNINGMWSDANRQMFYIPDTGEFVRWECWIDNNFEGRQRGELDAADLAIPIEVSELEDGIHTVFFRAQDSAGRWRYKSAEFELLPAGIDAVVSDVDSAQKKMYDLQGRRINETPKHGIYIIGNRKVLIRP